MNTKIALIADIHGNLPAFNAILNDLKKNGINKVIIAGDLITDCPDSDEVLNIIREMECTVIKGNREQYFLDHRAGLKEHWTHSRQMSALMWTFDRLSRKNRRYIESLPAETTVKVQDYTIKIVHGSPDSISELIYPVEKRDRFEEIMINLEEDILICGHCHQQWDHSFNGKIAINCGSAGVHYNKERCAEYSILAIEDSQISIFHRKVTYDLQELENRFRNSGLYEASPHWSQSVLNSIKSGENLSLKMIDYALNLMDKEGIKDALTIPDFIWDRAGEEYLINPD